jgi:hypothetical protein
MQYELNIAKLNGTVFYDGRNNPRYSHFAKVTLPLNDFEADAKEKARQFAAAFPSPEYKVTLMHWRNSGVQVEFADDIAADLNAMADAVAEAEPS